MRSRQHRALVALSILSAAACGGSQTDVDHSSLPVRAAPRNGSARATGADDSDIVLILPAEDATSAAAMLEAIAPWVTSRTQQGYTVRTETLEEIAAATVPTVSARNLTPEHIRLYLKARYSPRASTASDRGRYLGLLSIHTTTDEAEPKPTIPLIPRYQLEVAGTTATVPSDVPFGFTNQDSIDDSDGSVDVGDVDFGQPVFNVFRVPVTELADLKRFASRTPAFESARYKRDVALVAGQITDAVESDASMIQCANAVSLRKVENMGNVFKVFDADVCDPDFIPTSSTHRLVDFMEGVMDDEDAEDHYEGGVIYNISHGSASTIYFGQEWNLSRTDQGRIDSTKLNIFLSLACANDWVLTGTYNLARVLFETASVAVVSATVNTEYAGVTDIAIAELTPMVTLFQKHGTLLKTVEKVKSQYYKWAIDRSTDPETAKLLWVNLFSINTLGDGTVSVSP